MKQKKRFRCRIGWHNLKVVPVGMLYPYRIERCIHCGIEYRQSLLSGESMIIYPDSNSKDI